MQDEIAALFYGATIRYDQGDVGTLQWSERGRGYGKFDAERNSLLAHLFVHAHVRPLLPALLARGARYFHLRATPPSVRGDRAHGHGGDRVLRGRRGLPVLSPFVG